MEVASDKVKTLTETVRRRRFGHDMTRTDFHAYLEARRVLIDKALDQVLPPVTRAPQSVHAAMRHAVLGSGKRLRPILSMATSELVELPLERAMPCACAVELIHNASLILDDLPCMDNATERRGNPCVHVAFGEATALLAVMGLIAKAYELSARAGNSDVMACLAAAMGTSGLVAGQHADLALTGNGISIDAIEEAHQGKSAALFVAATQAPALLAGMESAGLEALESYARNLGLAFQITDDLLDAMNGLEDVGKDTFVSQLGAEGARNRVEQLVASALGALDRWGARADALRMMADYVGARSR